MFWFPSRFYSFTHLPHSFFTEVVFKIAKELYDFILPLERVNFGSKSFHVLHNVELLTTLGEVYHIFVLD